MRNSSETQFLLMRGDPLDSRAVAWSSCCRRYCEVGKDILVPKLQVDTVAIVCLTNGASGVAGKTMRHRASEIQPAWEWGASSNRHQNYKTRRFLPARLPAVVAAAATI